MRGGEFLPHARCFTKGSERAERRCQKRFFAAGKMQPQVGGAGFGIGAADVVEKTAAQEGVGQIFCDAIGGGGGEFVGGSRLCSGGNGPASSRKFVATASDKRRPFG